MGNRASAEEYFKYMKNMLKLADISVRSENDVKKSILCQLIFSKIIYAFQNIFSKEFQKKISNKYVINKKLLTEGFLNNNFLLDFIYNNNIDALLILFKDVYVIKTHTQKGKSYEVICINPLKKWHVKKRKDNSEKKQKNKVNTE